jgi:hypothetical protein
MENGPEAQPFVVDCQAPDRPELVDPKGAGEAQWDVAFTQQSVTSRASLLSGFGSPR